MIPEPVASDRLTADQVEQVRDLAARATEADGVPPLSEHVVLHLAHGGDERSRHLVVEDGGAVVAYAHLDSSDAVEGPSAELVVDPQRRGEGIGRALADAVLAEAGPRLRLWAHGEHPAAARLARSRGLTRARALWQMRRSLAEPLPDVAAPDGVSLRTFRPGADDDAWVALNARAFADHPEQGRWTTEDLRLRLAEPWFDPAGFFLAEEGDRLVGFHWTKVHGDPADDGGHGHSAVGEVYVVGVDPSAQGRGLGPWLTVVGLQHLRERGLTEAMLYVDEGNRPAVAVYERLGFRRTATDVSWSR